MNPRIIKKYEEELFIFIEKRESFRPTVYPCSKGVPTIGVGYALAEESGGSFRVRCGIDEDLAKISKFLTGGDRNRLIILCKMLNARTVVQARVGDQFKDRFDLMITKEQGKQLFRICVPKYDAVLRQRLGLKLYKELQNSHEMIALFSLAYNAHSLIGKNLVAALREGNRAEVQYQILYESNKDRVIGIDGRRHIEAEEIGRYDGNVPTAEELQAEAEVIRIHSTHISSYDNEMDGKRQARTAKRASGTKSAGHHRRKQQKPGAVTNQKEVRERIDQVKARSRNHGNTLLERMLDLFGGHDKVTYRDWSDHPAGLDEQYYHKRWS